MITYKISYILKVVGGGGGILALIGYILRYFLGKLSVKHSHRLEIEREMTNKIHKYMEKYYMPLLRSAAQAATSLQEKVEDKADPQNVIAFFYLSRYFSANYNVSKKMEGIFLRDLVIEALIGRIGKEAFAKITSQPDKYLSEMDASEIRKRTNPHELLADFRDKLNGEPLKSVFERYKCWRHDSEKEVLQVVDYLSCYSSLFMFGINRCYKAWYGKDALKLRGKDEEIIREELKTLRKELINQKQYAKYLGLITYSRTFGEKCNIVLSRLLGRYWKWPTHD